MDRRIRGGVGVLEKYIGKIMAEAAAAAGWEGGCEEVVGVRVIFCAGNVMGVGRFC